MEPNYQDLVAQAHPIYSIFSIIYDIIYGRTGGLLKKAYDYGQVENYQQMVLCSVLAAIHIAFVVAMIFAIGPWVKALIVAKFAASPLLAMTLTGFGTNAVNRGFGWIVDAINRNVL